MSLNRISKELVQIKEYDETHFSGVGTINDNMYNWTAILKGPPNSAYEGGVFNLKIELPKTYPFSPPKIIFLTKIYHPNISDSGVVCIDLLMASWSPALTIAKILIMICSLLNDPNPNNAFKSRLDMANLYKNDRKKYMKNVRNWTKKYAQWHHYHQSQKYLQSLDMRLRRSQRIKKKQDEKVFLSN